MQQRNCVCVIGFLCGKEEQDCSIKDERTKCGKSGRKTEKRKRTASEKRRKHESKFTVVRIMEAANW